MDQIQLQFFAGIGLAVLAAVLFVANSPVGVSITLLIVGIALIARARRLSDRDE